MGDNNVPAFKANTYYNWDNSDPDAIVILNRGTEYEFDVTNDIISFNTSNSIDSSTGSFTVTLDNKDDHLVNRFNNSRVKKMSSIEIFAKPLNSFKSKTNSTTSTTVQIPAEVNGKPPTLNSMFELVYGKELTPDSKDDLKQQFSVLNSGRVAPVQTGQLDLLALKKAGIQVVINPPGQTENVDILFFPLESQGAKLSAEDEVESTISISGNDKIIFRDEFYLRFTMNEVTLTTALQQYITVSQTQQKISLPADWDAPLGDRIRSAPLKFAMPSGMYERIFYGVVVNISVQTSPGSGIQVVMNGEGIGYWLKISYINTKPGGFETSFTGQDLTAFSTRFTELKALDVFRRLLSASTDIPTVANFNVGTAATSAEYLIAIGKDSKPMLDATGSPLRGGAGPNGESDQPVVNQKGLTSTQRLNDLELKRAKIWEGVGVSFPSTTATFIRNEQETKVIGIGDKFTGPPQNPRWGEWAALYRRYVAEGENNNIKKAKKQADRKKYIDSSSGEPEEVRKSEIAKYDKDIEALASANKALVKKLAELQDKEHMGGIPQIRLQLAALQTTKSTVNATIGRDLSEGRKSFLKQTGIIDHWKQIFSTLVLEVLDDDVFLENVFPYKYLMSSPTSSLEGDYVSKETIGRQIADFLQYEFYFDTNGHFVLKAPFFNMSYDQDNAMYTIEDDQVVNFSCNDTIDGLINRITVTGDFRAAPGAEPLITQNIFQDLRLIRDFGFHAKQIGELHYLQSTADCRDFGISMMSRNNMKLFNASVTIQGRPGIRLGTPVYFKPRDTVYYIKDISHEFSTGGQYTTTLGLIAGRRMVTGFKSTKTIRKFTLTPITTSYDKNKAKTVTASAITAANDDGVIDHYILSDGFNTESAAEYRAAAGIRDSEQALAQDGDALIGLNSGQANRVFILRNKYIIIDHYNPAFVGLVVDENSGAISDINQANYEYFNELNQSKIPQDSAFGNLDEPIRIAVTKYIKDKFDIFKASYAEEIKDREEAKEFRKRYSKGITDENAGRTFTIGARRDFITFFLREAAAEISNIGAETFGNVSPSKPTESESNKKTIGAASNIFNLLIAAIDRNGLYKKFTDDAGREVPGYQDYGLTLIYLDNQAKINNILNTDDTVNSNAKSAKNKKSNQNTVSASNAKSLSGAYSPDAKAFDALIQAKFEPFASTIKSTSKTVGGSLNSETKTPKAIGEIKPGTTPMPTPVRIVKR